MNSHDWCLNVLKIKSETVPDHSEPLHYFDEPTMNYHMPSAWHEGVNLVNIYLTLAGVTKRKTNALDSRPLALHGHIIV